MNDTSARDKWNRRYSTDDYVWNRGANQFVETYLADLEPGSAIDLGAGEGRNAVWLAGRGWRVTAVDFSSVGLEKGARLAADEELDISFVEADATTYEPVELVDLVIIVYLQLDEEGRLTALRRARSWLAPGGTVFVVAHDRSNVTRGYGGPPSPDVCYTVDETLDALGDLDVVVARVAERIVTTETGDRIALDTVVMASRLARPASAEGGLVLNGDAVDDEGDHRTDDRTDES